MYRRTAEQALHGVSDAITLDLILHISTRVRLDRCCSAFRSETSGLDRLLEQTQA